MRLDSREAVFDGLKAILEDIFEIDPGTITSESHLFDDLDLDSLDAIDMVSELKKRSDVKLESDDFRAIKTVDDVVNLIWSKQ